MNHQVKVPAMGESISEATISKLFVKVGDYINKDDTIAELETEKVNLVISAPTSGAIKSLSVKDGDEVTIDQVICEIDENASNSAANNNTQKKNDETIIDEKSNTQDNNNQDNKRVSPAASNLADINNIDIKKIDGTGPNGMIIKPDIIGKENIQSTISSSKSEQTHNICNNIAEQSHSVKMSALRKTIARRLKDAQNTAAILTTFNEVDMSAVMELRKKYQEDFQKKYGVKLGFMSLFAKAASLALQEIPAVNAQIEGDNIVYKNYCHIGIAIGTEKGLVVPVVRHCDKISFSDIEKEIINYVNKANTGLLVPADFSGGTFTISNGGTYGSMLSTPIINPPQSAILGMHAIETRPVVVNGEIVIRPMMYLALSYDHRIIDGSEAVRFLVKIKNYIENPQRMLLSC